MTEDKGAGKTSIVVFSGEMDKLMAAYIIGTGAAAMGKEVVMFHTFWGLRALKKNVRTGHGLLGKMIGFMYGGDITKAAPSKFNFWGIGRWMFKKMMKDNGVAQLVELRQMAIDLGVRLYPCQMSMDVMEIDREDLIDGVEDVVGVATFIANAQESDIQLFI